MHESKCRLLIVADFNADPLARYLTGLPFTPGFETVTAPYGQLMQVLLDHSHELWRSSYDIILVWTRPQSISSGFNRLLNGEQADKEEILAEVRAFAEILSAPAFKSGTIFFPSWLLPRFRFTPALLDYRSNGISSVVAAMNLALAEALVEHPAFYMLDSSRWIETAGPEAFNPRLWYMGKCWFGNPVCKLLAQDLQSLYDGLRGRARKMIVLDLDNTLWGGIVGDDGCENLRIGGHDPIGEAYADFQQALKILANRGVLLAIASKNEESTAMEAINRHPAMILREADFTCRRINWGDKAKNIAELAQEVNLGLHSIVFIDDNPVERARVREALPEVLVPEWPEDAMLYVKALWELNCFQVPAVSTEDRNRRQMLTVEHDRQSLRDRLDSVDAWIESLGIVCRVEELGPSNLQRVAQLFNKTNQMNLSTRRFTEAGLTEWAAVAGRCVLAVQVQDNFGDYGLTGVIGLEEQAGDLVLTDFILSCRVMGRKVEETMLSIASEYGRSRGLGRLSARCIRTDRNAPCLRFFMKSARMTDGEDCFTLELEQPQPAPAEITLHWNAS